MSRSPGSQHNLVQRASQHNIFGGGMTPAGKNNQVKMGNDDLGIGSTFLTEMKKVSKQGSRMNLNSQSPD